ncbi:uncharacterized protein BX663DRAFT_508198 [Cokeromyces recurvatus]|uniref:uncharacterized protein n=1 Tax=Cokeromyces recurvatus TaxID=90255 RepID=UPI002220A310|nr:uncharacterized protein BX663DRAFT_508198 [Cokeromyces recurvatus]KAI7903314.1 hypothetical protein BX663DRAFT_508198 [Cokeromyces recurvatus]
MKEINSTVATTNVFTSKKYTPQQNNKKKIDRCCTPEEEKDEPIFNIVYSAPTDIITPPPSPKSSPKLPLASQSFEANDRILTVKRHGQIKLLMAEYAALKKEGLLFTDHTYNLIFETYASLRRDGTPLTPMLKIYDEMLRSRIQPSSSTYTILIRTLCKRDVEVQKVIAMLKRQAARSSGINTNTNNMAELEAEQNIEKALMIFNIAVSENLVQFFDAELYNQILRVLSHYGNTEQSLHIYRQLEQHSTPTSATFAALINLFGRVGDLPSALTYFNKYLKIKDTVGRHDASYIYNALVDAHLKCHQLEGALKVIQDDMVSANIKISTIPYNSVIRYYCLKNQLDEAKKLIESMKQSSPQPDASSYGPILSTYCQLDLFKEATEMYNALIQTDISKSYGNLANYVLLCLKDPTHNSKIFDVIQDMKDANLELDANLAERIIKHFVNRGEVSQAISSLNSILNCMKPRTLAKGLQQIKNAATQIAIAAKGHMDQTLEVARLMNPHGLSIALSKLLIEEYEFESDHTSLVQSDYSILFDASLMIANDHSNLSSPDMLVFCLYDEMIARGFKVSHVLKARVASYLVQNNKRAAKKWNALFNKVEQTHVVSESEEASNAVMKAVVHGDLDKALEILQTRIVEPKLIPTVEPLRDAIAFVGKQGHLDAAVTMYRLVVQCFKKSELEAARVERAIYLMTNSILIGYAQQGDMIQAKKYYEQIKLMGRYPDGNGYASLLLGSAKCATDEATDALIIYEEAKRRDVKPTTFFYNVVISKLAKARKLDAALKLFEEMQAFKIVPNSITYGAIISACVRAGSELLACRLFNEMLSSPTFQPRVGPFNNMIQFYVRQQPNRKRALKYFTEMRRLHIKPSAHTYKLLMEAYALITPYDMVMAHRLLNDMESFDYIRPQATHYATLIHAYGLQHDVNSAQKIFEEMEATKDEVVYQAMLDALVSNNQLECAEQLYKQMQASIQKSSSPYIENVFIRGYGQRGLLHKARALFDAMSDDKMNDETTVIREPSTYEVMVRAYVDNNMITEAKQIFEQMIQREFPEKVTASVGELITTN